MMNVSKAVWKSVPSGDPVLAMARRYGIRVKMTLEHFRHLGDGRFTLPPFTRSIVFRIEQ